MENSKIDEKTYHPWLSLILLTIIIILGGFATFTQHAYHQAQHSFQQTYAHGISTRNTSSVLENHKPFSVLLLGTDTGALGRNDTGRTDTMILATVNPDKDRISLTSIPRDTEIQNIPNDSTSPDKINNAYSVGGASNSERVVNNFLHVPIDYYCVINMGGLEKMVNAVGGIDLKPNLTFRYGACNVKQGKMTHLNGKQALDYVRMRHQDPKGDYGRQARQRQVIQKLMMKGLQISSLPRYRQILQSLHGNLLTNIKFHSMMVMRFRYAHTTQHLRSRSFNEKPEMIHGISYQVPYNQQQLSNLSKNINNDLEE